jgi:hypothetical protein
VRPWVRYTAPQLKENKTPLQQSYGKYIHHIYKRHRFTCYKNNVFLKIYTLCCIHCHKNNDSAKLKTKAWTKAWEKKTTK